jgi:hypothetical protein
MDITIEIRVRAECHNCGRIVTDRNAMAEEPVRAANANVFPLALDMLRSSFRAELTKRGWILSDDKYTCGRCRDS